MKHEHIKAIEIPDNVREDLSVYGFYFTGDGWPRFNGGNAMSPATLRRVIKEYESGGDLESFMEKKGG